MNEIQHPPLGPRHWDVVRTKLDQAIPFANMRDTPYYRDAVYEQFSKQEYARRYRSLRNKMREHKLDAVMNRLVIALVVVGGLIGSSLLGIFAESGPHVMGIHILALFGFVVSGVLGIWLMWGVIRSGRL